jgi:hypothetical protein
LNFTLQAGKNLASIRDERFIVDTQQLMHVIDIRPLPMPPFFAILPRTAFAL